MKTDLNAAYMNLVSAGANLFDEGEIGAALVVFFEAFRLRPAAPIVLFNIARSMEELKDPRCEDFYAAAATQGNVDALYQLATFYVASNRTESAVASLKAYLKGNPQEDDCTAWARQALQCLSPPPATALVWNNPNPKKPTQKLSQECYQKQVKLGKTLAIL